MKASGKLPNPMAPTISPTEELSAITLRKVTWRLIPFLFVLYVIAWLDRVNVGFAALEMNADLGFSSATFGVGSGIFFSVIVCLRFQATSSWNELEPGFGSRESW